MLKKKIIVVIVEGPTDQTSLQYMLSKLYDGRRFHFAVVHGDITSDRGTNLGNVLVRIGNIVEKARLEGNFKKGDIHEVVHIVDMDGAYVPDSAVIEDPEHIRPFYTESEIRTANRYGILQRNSRKSLILDKISSIHTLRGYMYNVYFMSADLDHVLHGKRNCTDREKEENSLAFYRRCRRDIDEVTAFFRSEGISVGEDYPRSWKFIAEDLNSLRRHSNFNILLDRLDSEV